MSIKATRRTMISCYAQIINDYVLGYKITCLSILLIISNQKRTICQLMQTLLFLQNKGWTLVSLSHREVFRIKSRHEAH